MIWLFIIFLVAELLYFRMADKFNIIDKPNQRSSHAYITRRGGGIIFPFAWLVYSITQGIHLPWFTVGLLLISAVSFWDDIREVSVKTRISLHIIALSLAFYDLGIFNLLPWWGIIGCLVISLATLNAINFMDGINGITGLYALCFWISIALFAGNLTPGQPWDLISPLPYIILAILVFGFYNFRRRALCFAGDVGSVSMAYLIIGITAFLVFRPDSNLFFTDAQLLKTGTFSAGFELKYLLLLSVYGVDSFLTIIHRLILKENILKGHRKHLYQYMVNEFRLPHLAVASFYAGVQLVINVWVLNFDINFLNAITMLAGLSVFYVLAKAYIIHQNVEPVLQTSVSTVPKPKRSLAATVRFVAHDKKLEDVMPPVGASRKTIYEHEGPRKTETLRS